MEEELVSIAEALARPCQAGKYATIAMDLEQRCAQNAEEMAAGAKQYGHQNDLVPLLELLSLTVALLL